MPGRTTSSGSYRYGFNRKENDNEIKGEGNSLDFEARIYDSRVGRWLSLDPLQKKYPGETPYGFVSGNPIVYADADGRDKIFKVTMIDKDGKPHIHVSRDKDFFVYTKVDVPGFGNSRYYKNDLVMSMTIDERANKVSYSEALEDRKETSAASYYYDKFSEWGSNKNARGTQTSGITLTSEFSSQVDGPKTDATEGSSGSINIDYIMTAYAAVTKEAEALTWTIDKLPEITDLAKNLTELYQDSQKASPTTTSSNTKQEPVKKSTPPRDGVGWQYYIRDKNGKFVKSGHQSGLPDSTVKGKNGDPDTTYRRPFKEPPIPKNDIKGN